MKKTLLTSLLTLLVTLACAHEGVELGPNGGRILEFSKDETLHGELTVKEGRFHIALLDKDMKPVAIAGQTLTATTGDRQSPRKLAVETTAQGFSLPAVKAGEWLILQYRSGAGARPVTARFEYDTSTCEECGAPEWLCKCKP